MATIPWLADVLRGAGVQVVEHGDWRNRMVYGSFNPIGVLWHHTAARSSASNPHPALNTCIYGRPDLQGPLCQALVDYHGVFHVISAGRCNHAGAARASGPIPAGDGNTMLIGWEIDYDGVNQQMTPAQYHASLAATAAVLQRIGRDANHARGHRETSTGGKIDPSFINLDTMRADVAARMAGGGAGVAGQAFRYGDAQHFAAVGSGGSLVNLSWSPGTGILRPDWGGGPLTGKAVGYVHNGQQHVFARGVDNTLRHWWLGPGMSGPGLDNWNTVGRVLSNPTGFAYGNQQHVFFRNPDGHLEHRFYDLVTRQIAGGVWPGGAFVGNPYAFVHKDQQHIFGRTASGGLLHWFWWPGINPSTDNWGVTSGVASDPTGFSTASQHHVFFRNSGGHLEHRFFDDPSGTINGGQWAGGTFVGNPHAFTHGSQQHIFGRRANGDLTHWYWWPGINPGNDTWNAFGVVAGDPAGLSVPGQHHVFYRTTNGTLEHRFINDANGSLHVDNWGGSLAP